ncbi:hypothetical protein K501DRAFT_282660 [Backusella circina FSU 941]|nr:hypothetical protein K501DRAFT_282660 [Backusella circina FSU 941]
MAKTDIKGKGRESQYESDDEVVCFDIDDVSTWLKDNDSQTMKTPDRKPTRSIEDLLKSSPPSPLHYERKKKKDLPLPTQPVFLIEDNEEEEKKKPNILRDDLDLDASVAAIFKRKKGGIQRKQQATVKPVNMECPICSRMFVKEKIEIHASDCTGAYSESEDENESEKHGKRKKTMASGIAKSEAIRKKKFKNVEQTSINYYLQAEDMVGTDGGDFASSSSGLQWESAGQTRFA